MRRGYFPTFDDCCVELLYLSAFCMRCMNLVLNEITIQNDVEDDDNTNKFFFHSPGQSRPTTIKTTTTTLIKKKQH